MVTLAGTDPSPPQRRAALLPALLLVVGLGIALVAGQGTRGFGPVGSLLAVALWLVVWTLATLGVGRPIVDRCRIARSDELESSVLAMMAGTGVLVATGVVLSVARWFHPGPLLGALVAAATVGAWSLYRRPVAAPHLNGRSVLVAVPWVVALVIAATVTTFYDQWHQHLGFPWLWLREGHHYVIPRNPYTYMPVNSSFLYAFGLGSLGPWSAQAIHWWCGVLAVLCCAALGRRATSDGGGWWAAVLMATTPNALHLAAAGGSDLVVTMYAAGAWLALLATRDDAPQPARRWLLAGALAGLAAGTKYTALATVAVPLAAAGIVLHRPWQRGAFRPFAVGVLAAAGGAAATFGPWVARNWLATGAPLYPFLTGPFRSSIPAGLGPLDEFAQIMSGFDFGWSHIAGGLGLGSLASPIGGFAPAGVLWLPAAAAALITLPRMKRRVAAALTTGAVVGVLLWIVGLQVVRYLLPALVPMAAIVGGGIAMALGAATRPIRRAVVALVIAGMVWNLTTLIRPVGFQRLGCSLGVTPVEPLLARWVSSSLAFDAVRSLPEDARLLLVAESRALGFDRAVDLENPYPYGDTRLEALARAHDTPEAMAAELAGDGITHVLTNRWEARRMADMIDRDRYFNCGDDEVLARLDRFVRTCLDPVWLGHGVSIYRLDPSCRSSGAGDLATW